MTNHNHTRSIDRPIAVVGLGSIGRRHLQNLYALGQRRLIAVTRGTSPLPADELPPHQTEETLAAALKHDPIAVLVCNPTALHLSTALEAAAAGCHLFLEKPVSHQLGGVEQLVEIAAEKNLLVQVGFQFRFHPVLGAIKELLAKERLGRLVSVHVHWGEYLPAWHPWEDYRKGYSARSDLGGGVVLTLCHPFDYLRWMLGEIEGVYALTGHRSGLELDTEDTASVLLRFASGLAGTVYLDYVERPRQHTLTLIGDRGKVQWDNDTATALWYDAEEQSAHKIEPPVGFDRNDLFVGEIAHFMDSLSSGSQPSCRLEDGLRSLQIVEAVKESNKLRREVNPVELGGV